MLIDDNWDFEDKVSGLKFKVTLGKGQNRLRVSHINAPEQGIRDFFFTQEGEFTGTGFEFKDRE